MKYYKIKFKAVKSGAIGKLCNFTETIQAVSFNNAWLELYANYDHIAIISVNGKPFNILENNANFN